MSESGKSMTPLEVRAAFTREVLEHDFETGPLLLLAGPGAGKTYMLLETIRHQLDNGFDLGDFFEATLTNASADDFLEDAKDKISREFSGCSTLHFRAKGIMHRHAGVLGLDCDFGVVDKSSQLLICRDIQHLMRCTKSAVTRLLRQYRKHSAAGDIPPGDFADVYRSLQEFYVVLDWFDVVRLATAVLTESPEAREEECGRFRFLLVDEFQDLNEADQRLISTLLNGRTHFLAAGDDDQSIYGDARFAYPKGILEFEQDYPGATVRVLPVTSRLPSAVVAASSSLLGFNKERHPKDPMLPLGSVDSRADSGLVLSVNLKSDKAERQFIADALDELIHGPSPISAREILVLCHVTSLGRELVDWLAQQDYDYEVECTFADSKEDDVDEETLQLLQQFVADPDANLPLRGLLGILMGPASDAAPALVSDAMENSTSLLSAIEKYLGLEDPRPDLADLRAFSAAARKLDMWTPTLDGVALLVSEVPALGHLAGRVEELRNADPNESVDTPVDSVARVRFMTLHSSKGLDADFVFIPFMEDSLGPSVRDEEEARRLLYVAMTRAKVGVVFTWAWSRRTQERFRSRGTGGPPKDRKASRWIAECGIPTELGKTWTSPTPEDRAMELLRHHARVVVENDRAI